MHKRPRSQTALRRLTLDVLLIRSEVLSRIEAGARWLRGLSGARRLLVAAGFGALSALAFAPFYLFPLWFITFPALVVLLDASRGLRAAALAGWAFGAGYFFIGLHWVGFAFMVDADRHAWLLPFVAVLFPGGLALFFAAAAALARWRWPNGVGRTLVLASSLAVFEWLRGHVLTGLPWNLPGYVWSGFDAMFQSVSVFGIYGLSLVTLAVVLMPAAVFNADGTRSGMRWPLGVPVALLAALLAFGLIRLPSGAQPASDGIDVRIVQPNVPQAEKWKPELLARNWRQLIQLTQEPGIEARDIVVWPEAAPPLLMLQEPDALQVIAQVLPAKTILLTGVVRTEEQEGKRRAFNSMSAIAGGRVLAVYDKAHLVPFGEYLPLWQLLEPLGITKLTGGSGGYSEGPGVRTLSVAGAPRFGPLICYEIIFPGAVVEPGNRPDWLVNMTDDSWFGPWTGPYQHLGIAKVRAAEEGLPIVRAANTGVSAVIDPFGRIVSSFGLDRAGILDAPLPRPIDATIYSIAGDTIFFLLLLALAGGSGFFFRSANKGS